jgi:hypothetical protein
LFLILKVGTSLDTTHRPHSSVHPGTPSVEEVGHHHDLV